MSTDKFSLEETVVEAITWTGAARFLLVILLNCLPGIIICCVWTGVSSNLYQSAVEQVLDALEAQPTGYVEAGYDYASYEKASRAPPGDFHGGDHVYGNRADLGPEYANTPSMSVLMMGLGYYSFGIPGHPDVGMGVAWKPLVVLLFSRAGFYGFPTILFMTLFGTKTEGKGMKRWLFWPLGFIGSVAVVIMSVTSAAADKAADGWQLKAIVYYLCILAVQSLTFKFGFGAKQISRGVLCPMFLAFVVAFAFPILAQNIVKDLEEDQTTLVFVRLFLFPIFDELFCAPVRLCLRGCNMDGVDKDGLCLALVPLKYGTVMVGRAFMYKVTDPGLIVVVNVGLMIQEMVLRITVSNRDKAYTLATHCCKREKVTAMFREEGNVKFRCNNSIVETILEYIAMVQVGVSTLLVRMTNDPANVPSVGTVLFNLFAQITTEVFTDLICIKHEVNKHREKNYLEEKPQPSRGCDSTRRAPQAEILTKSAQFKGLYERQ